MRELEELRKIRETCPDCKWAGYIPKKMANCIRLEDCKCVQKIAWQIKLIEANIPEKYRAFDFRSLTKEFIANNEVVYAYLKKYLEKIGANIKKGNGFWLSSPPGLAKSSIVSYFLWEAIKQGFYGYYIRASYLLTKKFEALRDPEAKEFIEFLLNEMDVIVIEEIEKIYLLTELDMPNQLFFEFLSDLYDHGISIFLTSNEPRRNVLKKFPGYIQDRLATLEYMTLQGQTSGRREFG